MEVKSKVFIIFQLISVGICFFTSSTNFGNYYMVNHNCVEGPYCTTPEDTCKYSRWSTWSNCSDVCSPLAQKTRTRTCLKDTCSSGECPSAPTTETLECLDLPCCEGFPKWLQWGPWDRVCGRCRVSKRQRGRKCSKCADKRCPGRSKGFEACPDPCAPECVEKTVWSPWSYWRIINETKLTGFLRRTEWTGRKCPTHDCLDGSLCLGIYIQTAEVVFPECRTFWAGWSFWSRFNFSGPCNTFQTRTRTRECRLFPSRTCTPELACQGVSEENKYDIKGCCKVVITGGDRVFWSQWTQWSNCTRSCGHGIQKRTRKCKGKKACRAERICVGEWKETRTCFTWCCDKVKLGQWGAWSACKKPCGGMSTRKRKCKAKKCPMEKEQCASMMKEKRPCPKCI